MRPTPDIQILEPNHPHASKWFPVARVLRPQGRRGELLCEALTDIDSLFAKGTTLQSQPPFSGTGPTGTVVLENAWSPQGRNAGRIVLKITGADSISAAETLKGYTFSVQDGLLPALDEGSFLVRDLVGCVFIDDGQRLGQVTEVQFAVGPDGRTRLEDAPDLLVVQLDSAPEAEPVMIPFVKLWLEGVDVAKRELRMKLPAEMVRDLQALSTVGDEPAGDA